MREHFFFTFKLFSFLAIHQLTPFRPGVIYLFSFFYLRHEVGFRCGIFASAAPLASTFAGALAYGITSGHSKLSNWRLLFLVEGLPTILMAPIAYFFIPDSPDRAKFLNLEERAIVRARAVRQTGTSERLGSLNIRQLAQTLLDAKAWFLAVRTATIWVILALTFLSCCTSVPTSATPACPSTSLPF